MYKIPLSELKQKIAESGKISATELEIKIKSKISELSGLISEEGAAHIIANELGIQLTQSTEEKLKIKDIYAGMKSVTTVGKVVRKFETREFAKGESMGKVCSLVLGDETSTIRVVFWNEQVDLLEQVNEHDILIIKNAYVRENKGGKEVHLGNNGEIEVNPEGVVIENVRQAMTTFARKSIEELQGGEEGVEILGTVVQVFDPRFFEVCSECNKRVRESAGAYTCETHGEVKPLLSYVMNLVVDDGTGNIRGIFWKNQTNNLLNKEETDMGVYKENPAKFEEVKTSLFGEQFKLMGRVKMNDMFNRLEFNVQMVEKADAQEEIARLEKVE
ncbi:hypothetical protein COV12_02065 [Candidatus Woesearchaeota archaeon CG10_big_fil_rev_8_21_14_0_10_32_24]|nr:MAG: hypothetical protein COV12_02065 [Candidatus Woesearchaeota archaeon CG10_big_fil_rev_8_21_14_0_10_32_24]